MSIPALRSVMKGRRIEAAEDIVASTLRTARTLSITQRKIYTVDISYAANRLYIQSTGDVQYQSFVALPDLTEFIPDSEVSNAYRTRILDNWGTGGSNQDADTLPDVAFSPDGRVLDDSATEPLKIGVRVKGAAPSDTKENKTLTLRPWTGSVKRQ